MLTKLWIKEDGRAKTMASLTGGGAGAELAEGVLQRFSGRLDSAGRLVVLLRRSHGGQGGRGTNRGEESRWRRDSPAAMSGGIPARWWRRPRAASSGKVLGLTWSCCAARGGPGCGRVTWPRRRSASSVRRSRGAARVCGAVLRCEDGEERVAGAKYRRGPGISAGRSGIRIPANSPVISAAALRCRQKGKGRVATEVWGRSVRLSGDGKRG